MKWIVLSVAVFLGSTMVFVAVPQPALHWARTVVVQSLEVFTDGTAPVAVRTNVPAARTDAGSDRAESRQRETIQSDLAGRARVIDGDTIVVGSARIRLFGVDAPESAQSCVAGSRPWSCDRARSADGAAPRLIVRPQRLARWRRVPSALISAGAQRGLPLSVPL